jgi:NADH-quinone oxidoreductase subunit L
MGSGIAAAVVGIGLAWSWYSRPGVEAPRRLAEQFAGLHRLVFDKWRVDELYDATILRASRALGVVSAGIDKVVVDGLLTRVTSAAVQGAGFLFTRMQNGLVQAYAAVMVGGLLVVTWWFTVPHVRIDVPQPPSGDVVDLRAGAGLGYQYRWDFDSDGHFDTEWSADNSASHTYANDELQPGVVVVLESALYGQALSHKRLAIGDQVQLETQDLGNWQNADDDTPPVIEATERGIIVHKNGARVRFGGKSVAEDGLAIARGEHVDIGQARVTVAGLARPTLRVRNAFGVERQNSGQLLLPEVTQRPAVEVVGLATGDAPALRGGAPAEAQP